MRGPVAVLTCWLKGHDWHLHGAWFRYCRRCKVEQVWANPGRWLTHR